MKRTKYQHKAVLHIPQQAWVDGELVDLDLTEALEKLSENLEAAGITSYYETQATGHYKGRSYPEMLLTIFGTAETSVAVNVFMLWYGANRDTLRQEAFAYELDGELFVYQSSPPGDAD